MIRTQDLMYALIASLILALSALPAAAQNIYKSVDEDGNVVYTDEPPSPEAQPMDLPPITVADPYEVPAESRDVPEGEREEVPDVLYPDLGFISPVSEEHFWGTGGSFTAQLGSAQSLAGDHQVQFFLNGQEAGTSSSYFLQISGVDRGEHAISAAIVDASGQVVARAGPVVFYMRQHSALHPNNARRNNGSP